MLELEAARQNILNAIGPATPDRVGLDHAHQRILLEDVSAPLDLPAFDNSSMDGYALRAEDVAGARNDKPVSLRLAGKVAAGQSFSGSLSAGQCIRIFTGSPLPAGADAVVMQEDTRVNASRPEEILIIEPPRPWENVRFRGEDVKRGTVLGRNGDPVTIGCLGLLAASGVSEVSVGRQPSIALLATGSELKQAGDALAPGQIYESSRASLGALIRRAGGLPKSFPIVRDEPNTTRAALERGFAECDLVVTCGGVSVGEMDFVKSAFEQLGGTMHFWKVAIKPGKPFVFGRLRSKLLFGLPGNPVSAFVTFLLLVYPALRRWQGASNVSLPCCPGVLTEPLANPGTRRHFMRVAVDPAGKVRPAGIQASHVLSSLAAANGLVDVPPQMTLTEGASVEVMRWE